MAVTLQDVNDIYGGALPPGETLAPPDQVVEGSLAKKARKSSRPSVRGRKDRWALFNAFADTGLHQLVRAEIVVWISLFRDTKIETGLARTGQTDLARRCGCSIRTIHSAIHSLQEKGFILIERRGRINAGASVYRVKLPT